MYRERAEGRRKEKTNESPQTASVREVQKKRRGGGPLQAPNVGGGTGPTAARPRTPAQGREAMRGGHWD